MQPRIFACLLMVMVKVAAAEVCSSTDSRKDEFKVFYGWPFSYYCPQVLFDMDYDYDDKVFSDFSNITCVITEVGSGEVLMNSTFMGSVSEYEFYGDDKAWIYQFDDVNASTPTEYEVHLQKASYCLTHRFSLLPLKLPAETCEENMERLGSLPLQITAGNPLEAKCDVYFGDEEDIPAKLIRNFDEDPKPNGTKAYWLFNCRDRLPNNTAMRPIANEDATSLYFEESSYDDNLGVYTCVVEHGGMKRYRIHYEICIKPQVSSLVSLKCSNTTARPGEDAEIECLVDAGLGAANSLMFTGWFNKLNSTAQIDKEEDDVACIAYVGEVLNATDKRISCGLYQNKIKARKCFFDPPTKKELDAHRTKVKMVYRIRNVKESDFGSYRVRITRPGKEAEAVIFLSFDVGPGLIESHTLLIVCLSTIGGILLISLLLWIACKIEIRWIWFKLFAPREKETRKYAAYLAYYYSKDMLVTSPKLLESFVMSLSTRIRAIGGDVFDRCRDPGSEQYTAECISAKLGECHRVVIVLTPEYINDHWGLYEAYEAWKVVIENGTKIIFIMFPKTAEVIDGLPEDLKTTLNKALQRHSVVTWDGSLPFTRRMRMKLELLMPKLPKQYRAEFQRNSSTQNGHISSVQNGYHSGVHPKDNNGNVCGENAV